jgi:hypothetical protein
LVVIGNTYTTNGYQFGSNSNYLYQSSSTEVTLLVNSTSATYVGFKSLSGVPLVDGPGGSLALGTSGTESVRIDSSGNMLVGLTTALTNPEPSTAHNIVCTDDVATGCFLIGTYSSFIGRQSSDGSTLINSGQGSLIFSYGGYPSQVETMRIDGSGNVGIGTNNPTVQLQQYKSSGTTYRINQNGSVIVNEFASTDVNAASYGTSSNHVLGFKTNNVQKMAIGTDGIITGTAGNLMLVSGTAQASTSGTSIDFTGIPSWVKKVTVLLNGVSTNGTSLVQIQTGAGSVTTSGYNTSSSYMSASTTSVTSSTGFIADSGAATAASVRNGILTLTLLGSNTWIGSGLFHEQSAATSTTVGQIALGGALDRVRITTVNGTDAFDAGSINILYE